VHRPQIADILRIKLLANEAQRRQPRRNQRLTTGVNRRNGLPPNQLAGEGDGGRWHGGINAKRTRELVQAGNRRKRKQRAAE